MDFVVCSGRLFLTLLPDVALKVVNLTGHCFDSGSETEIIPFSIWVKSGGGSIAQAAGCGGDTLWTGGVELQPTLASSNIPLQIFNGAFGICQLSGVFGVKCAGVTLSYLHIADCSVSLVQLCACLISLLFVHNGI